MFIHMQEYLIYILYFASLYFPWKILKENVPLHSEAMSNQAYTLFLIKRDEFDWGDGED